MSSQIDLRTLPANVPVLCIPRVKPNINESHIRKIFNDLNMGVLEHIDIVSKTTEKGEKTNRVFIHFRYWNHSENANIARERLLNGKEIKIIYDDPWFWKISAYREAPYKQYSNRETPKYEKNGRSKIQHNILKTKPKHEQIEDNPDENVVEYLPIGSPIRHKKDNITNEDKEMQKEN